jgi:hypothetical protein
LSKSIKYKNDTYLDSSSVIHGRKKLNELINELLTDSGKKSPSLMNGWCNKSFNPCYYRKIGKIVYVYGVIGGGGNDTTIFTLPAGYRPAYMYCSFICRNDTGTCRILVDSTGDVYYQNINGNGNEVSLYGISFFVD